MGLIPFFRPGQFQEKASCGQEATTPSFSKVSSQRLEEERATSRNVFLQEAEAVLSSSLFFPYLFLYHFETSHFSPAASFASSEKHSALICVKWDLEDISNEEKVESRRRGMGMGSVLNCVACTTRKLSLSPSFMGNLRNGRSREGGSFLVN